MPELPSLPPQEVVYVLGALGSFTVKIGRTTNLQKRVAEIQRMSPVPLAALWSCPGGHRLETNLHRHFKAARTHGEWFAFDTDPVALIRQAVEAEPWLLPRPPSGRSHLESRPTVIDLRPAPDPRKLAQQVARVNQAREKIFRDLEGIADPLDRLAAMRKLEAPLMDALATVRQETVLKLKSGRTWQGVGALIGVSGARAEQISRRAR
ncbi:GIY-YIG nuclease family protein [Streptomyces sp. NPDC006173]|uniref:GIY-YIG nuclease family protein n=1 Tax=Streptomyces sp. NPDC006173 TaxID=3155349 RepID=UPI003409DCDA